MRTDCSLTIEQQRLDIEAGPELEKAVFQGLQEKYRPVILPTKKSYLEKLSLSGEDLLFGVRSSGEVFCFEEGIFFYRIPHDRAYLEAGYVSEKPQKEGFGEFLKRLTQQIGSFLREPNPVWQKVSPQSEIFQHLREEGRPFYPHPDDLRAARQLEDADVRSLLSTIERDDRCSLGTLSSEENPTQLLSLLEKLEAASLIRREYVIYCKDSGSQIGMSGSLSSIQEYGAKGVKCLSCGRTYSEERIDQSVSCTPLGKVFALPNYWLTVILVEFLARAVPPEQLLVHFDEENGLVDLFLATDGNLIYFLLKETPFALPDAFLFRSKLGLYRPSLAALLSPVECSSEVFRAVGAYRGQTPAFCLRGLGALDQEIPALLEESRRLYIENTLKGFIASTAIELERLILEYFYPSPKRAQERQEVPLPTPSLPPASIEPADSGTGAAVPVEPPRLEPSPPRSIPAPILAEMLSLEEEPEVLVPLSITEDMELPTVLQDQEAARAERIQALLEDLPQGISVNRAALERRMQEISQMMGAHTYALFSLEGESIFYGHEEESAFVPGVLGLWDKVRKGMNSLPFGEPNSVIVSTGKESLHLWGAKGGGLLVLSGIPDRPSQVRTFPDGAATEEILESVQALEGVAGSLVLGTDGLLIESLYTGE
ncbi:MAG: hypothetical protein HYU64_17040, partial [Armatimonadetes bacterium]|nr:hypothetical protein [Armatimonadota bacterium]